MKLVVYTKPGTEQHDRLCDAFLGETRGWYVTDRGDFWEVATMDGGWGPGAVYTRWVLLPPHGTGQA